MSVVESLVAQAGDGLLAHARAQSTPLAGTLREMVAAAPASETNAQVAARFDALLEERATGILDDWWEAHGPATEVAVLGKMTSASAAALRQEAGRAADARRTDLDASLERLRSLLGSDT